MPENPAGVGSLAHATAKIRWDSKGLGRGCISDRQLTMGPLCP